MIRRAPCFHQRTSAQPKAVPFESREGRRTFGNACSILPQVSCTWQNGKVHSQAVCYFVLCIAGMLWRLESKTLPTALIGYQKIHSVQFDVVSSVILLNIILHGRCRTCEPINHQTSRVAHFCNQWLQRKHSTTLTGGTAVDMWFDVVRPKVLVVICEACISQKALQIKKLHCECTESNFYDRNTNAASTPLPDKYETKCRQLI